MHRRLDNAFTINLETEEPPRKLDVIVSLMALHHIPEIETQLEKLSGWMEQEGYLCLCDLDKEDGSFHQEEQVPHKGFERGFIKKCLEDHNVRVVSESTVFINKKISSGREREYPVFMIVGKKIA